MKNKGKKIFDWSWIKGNFWNVVAILILWQLLMYLLLTILVTIFGIGVPVA